MNLYKDLLEDEKYKQLLETLKEEEKEALNDYMKEFMKRWENQFFSPLKEYVNDKEFQEALSKKIDANISNNKG